MLTIRSRVVMTALLGATLWLLSPLPSAYAMLGEGDAAPDFEGRDFINAEPFSLKNLRGRIVLLELFSTG